MKKQLTQKNHDRDSYARKNMVSKKRRYYDGYADFGDFKVYDKDVAVYVKKHLRFFDRFDIQKVTEAVLYSFSILSKSVEPPEGNWKF